MATWRVNYTGQAAQTYDPARMTTTRAAVLAACTLALIVYVLRLNGVAGMYVDDAWYVMFAQAIASGMGYHLISAPTPEMIAVLPSSPPGFPLALAAVMLFAPSFPANVFILKSISIAAMLGTGALAAIYYRDRSLPVLFAIALALVVILTPAFVFMATSTVMSEPLFTLAQLATVVLIARGRPIAAGVTGAAAVLIRSAGLPLLAAGAIFYLVRRDRRSAAQFVITAIVLMLPWAVYARANATPIEQRLAHGGAHVFTYSEQFWMRRAGDISSGKITASELPARIGDSLFDIFGRDMGAIVLPELYRSPTESGEETLSVGGQRSTISTGSMGNTTGTIVVSGLLSVLALIGFIARWRQGAGTAEYLVPLALVPIVVFPHWAFRFVLPLTPFLYDYLVAGVQTLTPAWRQVLRITLASLLCLHVLDHGLYRMQVEQAVWIEDAREVDQVLEWMQRELKDPAAVASTNPALIYLRTGRRGVAIDDARGQWQAWRALGVRYVVSLRAQELPDPSLPYRVLFKTPRSGMWVVEATD
jgi:hypothetical protein